jgi:cleavage and polyadenylation specificity factor subunit 3
MINLNLGNMAPGQMQQIPMSTDDDGEFLEIMPLGAGCEVGRSCIYMQCKGRKIMLDCGLHPAREGI